MKKTIITLILILFGLYILLSVFSIGDEYSAEKLLYRAAKVNEKIVSNPDVAPPKMLAVVESTLKKVIEKYPTYNAAKMAYLALAEFYLSHKKYDAAISVLNTIISKPDKDASLLSRAYFLKGNTYERQGQWDKALKEYLFLRDNYIDTALGLQMPMYITAYYIRKGQEGDADKAFREAAAFYEKLGKDNQGKVLGYKASTLLRDAYLGAKEYEKAGEVVKDIINNYFSQVALVEQLPYVEPIYVNTLKTPGKAIEIYKSIIEKAKDKKLEELLNKKIEAIKAGKPEKR